jgi:HTH-type transcriptional regulator, sugar sensing transcriptional regulator
MDPEHALAQLGFTDLEARLYCELLRAAPASAYRLAQIVGKAPANVYQALASMAQKGIVFTDEGETKAWRPAPLQELMGDLQRRFDERRRLAEAALLTVQTPPERDRVYQLRTARQVMDRARALVAGAKDILLFDLYPGPFAALREALMQAAASGVTVAGVAYEPTPDLNFPCVRTVGAALRDRMPGQQVTVIADGREFLMAHLSPDGANVLHGIWSDSAYLACMQHSGLSSEIRLSALEDFEAFEDPLAYVGLLQAAPDGLFALRRDGKTADAPGVG